MNKIQAEKRLKEIKRAIEKENISYGEIAELQGLKKYIGYDTVLREWAGMPELTAVKSSKKMGSIRDSIYLGKRTK